MALPTRSWILRRANQAREYVMSLGYLQAPVVVTDTDHWSGFRPDRIKALAERDLLSSDATLAG